MLESFDFLMCDAFVSTRRTMMNALKIFILSFLVFGEAAFAYQLGVGRADVTGPIVQVTLMGYGKFGQKGTGLHTRQYSKAYIIKDDTGSLVFINVDVAMMGDGVRMQVLKTLREKYGSLYTTDNVMISGTHTHSAPGGFMMHTFFDIPSGGFSRETFNALVSGIVRSVDRAHESLQEGKLFLAKTEVSGITVNRSPTSYRMNPLEEIEKYMFDVDKDLIQLQFFSEDGLALGAINWFPIHGTSLNNTNTLVSSDNIGYAALALEKFMELESLQGKSKFVAAFASSNLGDVSPNMNGPKCHRSGTQCTVNSKCQDMFEECYAMGPGKDMYDSVALIGLRLATEAWELLKLKKGVEITGPIRGIHQYVDMTKARGVFYNKASDRMEKVKGCSPAMGYSAGAGTTDGQFLPFLYQGMTRRSWWVDAFANMLARPTKEERACHAPKPILVASSHLSFPFDWQPKIVSTQLGRIGNLAIACVPGEFTTMAGRRMREALKTVLGEDAVVVIAGLCNTYSDYITTYEEYQAQRYEAASTLYGPHTLTLHVQQYQRLAHALITNETLSGGPVPEGLNPDHMVSLIPPIIFDAPKRSHKFGDVLVQPRDVILDGQATARATFVGANPRNNLKHEDTYFVVEEEGPDGEWKVIATDADVNTRLYWRRTNVVEGNSEVDVEWAPTLADSLKQYRFRYFGHYKCISGDIGAFEGVTEPFTVQMPLPTTEKIF